jgi:hypothetical protein
MLQVSDSWRRWWDGDPAEMSLVSVAEQAVRESDEQGEAPMSFDESNGLFMVLAGSLIFDLLRGAGETLRQRLAGRSTQTEVPHWIRNETWSSDEGR